ncbi:hypothetical protein [Aliivibrio fischeri]|uniref:hypothetical protein n=1 Tax=Aliivibrio fischeri TaxID=668 RepID=UPI0009BD57ED|nr:hypothetical protein [Aliivibrio fischeri]
MTQNQHKIAGWKTRNDWQDCQKQLEKDSSPEAWTKVFEDFFKPRLEKRYLSPIAILQEHGEFSGEGFSIMTILCSLIEFLESTYQGKNYKFLQNGERIGEHEYSSSKAVFISFLTSKSPFSEQFNEELATEFYKSIRCGLLHEATTKNDWRIQAQSSNERIICNDKKLVFRDNFETGVRKYIDNYCAELIQSQELQQAFIRKWCSL